MATKTKMTLGEILERLDQIGGGSNRPEDVAVRTEIRSRPLPDLDAIAIALEAQSTGSSAGLLLTRLAQDEHAECKAARASGKPIPATPFLEALTRRQSDMASTKAKAVASGTSPRSGGGTRAPKASAVHFTHDGKLVSATQNKLSSVAWFYTKPLGAGGGRMKVGELKSLLAELGVSDPFVPGWSVALPNGVTLGAVAPGSTPAPVEKPKMAAPKKPAASTAKKPAARKATTKGIIDAVKRSAKSGPNAAVTKAQAAKKSTGKATSAPSKLAPDKRVRKSTAKA